MANLPKYTGDREQDSWAFQVTTELNNLPRPRRLDRLPNNPLFGEEIWIGSAYTVPLATIATERLRIDNDDAMTIQPGWYKFVDSRYGWSAL